MGGKGWEGREGRKEGRGGKGRVDSEEVSGKRQGVKLASKKGAVNIQEKLLSKCWVGSLLLGMCLVRLSAAFREIEYWQQ